MYHFFQLTYSIPHYEWESHKGPDVEFASGIAEESKINLTNFIIQWNQYVDNQNRSSFWINLFASLTYFISAFMSVIAMFLPGEYNIKKTAKNMYRKFITSKSYNTFKRNFKRTK